VWAAKKLAVFPVVQVVLQGRVSTWHRAPAALLPRQLCTFQATNAEQLNLSLQLQKGEFAGLYWCHYSLRGGQYMKKSNHIQPRPHSATCSKSSAAQSQFDAVSWRLSASNQAANNKNSGRIATKTASQLRCPEKPLSLARQRFFQLQLSFNLPG
jgi:hypothetical protein